MLNAFVQDFSREARTCEGNPYQTFSAQIQLPLECIAIEESKETKIISYKPYCLVQYGEFRSGYGGDQEDTRLVFYGLRYLLETYLLRQWTLEDVEKSEKFFR